MQPMLSGLKKIFKKRSGESGEDISHLLPVLSSIRDGLVIIDTQGKVIFANSATEIITGLLPFDLLGHHVQEVFKFECAHSDLKAIWQIALSGWEAVAFPEDCRFLRKEGKFLPIEVISTPFYTSKGVYAGLVFLMRDITEKTALKRRQYEFLSFVSHQLRQPLGSLRWGIEIVSEEKGQLSSISKELLDDLLVLVVRLAGFINKLVDVSRFETGKIDFKSEPVNVRELIGAVISELRGLSISYNVVFNILPSLAPGESFIITGDRDRLYDVFLNLVSNAIRYNKPGGAVICDVRILDTNFIEQLLSRTQKEAVRKYLISTLFKVNEKNKFILIYVADTGIGIPRDEQEQVFGSFFRGTNVLERGLKGSGLGLVIVKSIVERMGGKIFFESEENRGTTFYLIFPYT